MIKISTDVKVAALSIILSLCASSLMVIAVFALLVAFIAFDSAMLWPGNWHMAIRIAATIVILFFGWALYLPISLVLENSTKPTIDLKKETS